MFRIVANQILLAAAVLIAIFRDKLSGWFGKVGLPTVTFYVLVVVLIVAAYVALPAWKELNSAKQHDRIEQKIDQLLGTSIGVRQPDGSVKEVPRGGLKATVKGLNDEMSLYLVYGVGQLQGITFGKRQYIFDLISALPQKNRVSCFVEQVRGINYLSIQVTDAVPNDYILRFNISNWLDHSKHILSVVFNGRSKNISLRVDGALAVESTIPSLVFAGLGEDLYLGRAYSD